MGVSLYKLSFDGASTAARVEGVRADGVYLRSTAPDGLALGSNKPTCADANWCSGWSATRLACAAKVRHLLEAYACARPALLKLAFKGARAHFRVLAAQVWLKLPVDRFAAHRGTGRAVYQFDSKSHPLLGPRAAASSADSSLRNDCGRAK